MREKSFPSLEIISGSSVEEVDINLKDMLPGLFQGKNKKRKLKVPEALEYLTAEEEQKLIDMDSVARAAVQRVEQAGIIFLDEIDKIAGREGSHGPEVSREGVQRDILPIVEGTTVNTKYGMVRTDHILFIAAGAFHVSKPSDLIPELQGRFPIRVELEALGKDEFVRILTEPRNALIKQYVALMDTEGVTLAFTDDAIRRDCRFRDHRQRAHREHRRAAAAHGAREAARRDLVRGVRPGRQDRDHRRRLRDPDARGHRQERRPVAVHSVMATTYNAEHAEHAKSDGLCGFRDFCVDRRLCLSALPAARRARRCRRWSSCRRRPATMRAERRGDPVDVTLTVPSTNTDGSRPANIASVDVYAVTLPLTAAPLSEAQLLKMATRVASVAVKAPADPDATVDEDEPDEVTDPPEGKGLDQGAAAHVHETADAGDDDAGGDSEGQEAPLRSRIVCCRWPVRRRRRRCARTRLSASSTQGKKGPLSKRVTVPLVPPPPPPTAVSFAYDEKAVTLKWAPVAPPVTGPAAADRRAALDGAQRREPDDGLQRLRRRPAPSSVKLTATPVAEPTFTDPRVVFGEKRCYVVRTAETISAVGIESDASAPIVRDAEGHLPAGAARRR